MKISKILVPIGAVLIGLVMGYVIFNKDANEESKPKDDVSEKQEEKTTWTCSMHPQIQKPEPGDCPICGMDLIPMKSEGGTSKKFAMTPDAMKLANIQTLVIGDSSNATNKLGLSGKIKADETSAASVVSHIPGRIEKLYVRFTGEKIYKGQKIAAIYSPNLITAQKELIEAYKMKDVNPQLYEASLNKLKYWKIKQDQIDQIIETQKIQESFDIYADHSGVVMKKNVNVGDHLMEGEPLFMIQNLNQLWGVFDVYEQDLQMISKGQNITFSTPAYPEKKFTAKVVFVDPVIDPQTRTAEVRVEINNSKNKLKPEMFIEGHLNQNVRSNRQLTVPSSAVLWTGKRSVVYIFDDSKEQPTFEYREVLIGDKVGDQYPILKGLKAGEEIVVHGNFVIDAAAQLQNKKSMMTQEAKSSEHKHHHH